MKHDDVKSYLRLSQDEIDFILENANKKSTKEMAEWIGCNISAIRYHLRINGVKTEQFSHWSPEKRQEILELRKNGLTTTQISRVFNTTASAIRSQLIIMRRKGIISN